MKSELDAQFLQKQRQELLRLRATLKAAADDAEAEEADINAQRSGEALEAEEDAQGLDALERGDNLLRRNAARLAQVDRALKKIEEGTYGLSDISGQPIPRERLEASPEAVCTVGEERAAEKPRR
ncbi:MAG: TraR/DksA family transcriptional regulator [Proteobacteria bacterium]|nr:TraR/DksA family transcriptional regulator [Pseudomonadota bacterium]